MKKLFILISKLILPVFYSRKFLKGKNFQDNVNGYLFSWRVLWDQKVKGYNRHIPFPVHPACVVGLSKNLEFDPETIDNFWKVGSYFQCWKGRIHIGKGTWIAQNVGIITENHSFENLDKHLPPKDVFIGNDCWIGMNSVILPGVTLGDRTMVGAGSIVTKSFTGGGILIAGNPAKIIRRIDNEKNQTAN